MSVYSMTRVSRGGLLFVSGQVPVTADSAVPDGAAAQTRVVLARIDPRFLVEIEAVADLCS